MDLIEGYGSDDAPQPTTEGGSGEGNSGGTGGLADDGGVEGSGHGEQTTNEATSGSAHGAGACGGGSFSSSSSTAFTAAIPHEVPTVLRNHSNSERESGATVASRHAASSRSCYRSKSFVTC